MATICVYCGSSPGADPAFAEAARNLGTWLAEKNHRLVYGGGNVGLMGIVADAVLDGGGEVIGVIPESLVAKEVAHRGLTQLITVGSMHERKARMAELADCFVALPGGTGTLEEIIEVFVWTQLGLQQKACGLLNLNGFYDGLIQQLGHMCESRLLKQEHLDQLYMDTDPVDLVNGLLSAEIRAIDKWMDRPPGSPPSDPGLAPLS